MQILTRVGKKSLKPFADSEEFRIFARQFAKSEYLNIKI